MSGLGFGDLGAGVTTGGAGSPLGIGAEDFFTGMLPLLTGSPNDDEFEMIFRFQAITGDANSNTSAKVGIAIIP